MVYLPTFTKKNQPNVGIYTIHGSYGHHKKTHISSDLGELLNVIQSRSWGPGGCLTSVLSVWHLHSLP